ncbi:MAG: D-alanyl-D-alanine carboxypeptidase family protein [Caulobacteraceae bacterium]
MIWRLLRRLLAVAAVLGLGWIFLREVTRNAQSPAKPAAVARLGKNPSTREPDCRAPAVFSAPAARNAASLSTAAWAVFGRPEMGWETYAPLAAREIGSNCRPTTEGFAAALAVWQGANGAPTNGVMDEATLKALDLVWLRRRPFVAASAHGACPPPPAPERLSAARSDEGYQGKAIQLRAGALAAWRRMVAAARTEEPAIAADPRLLTIFSGYRDPGADAARCAVELNCGTSARAFCSAHRTGLAMDLYLGAAPGFPPESSADANRLFQSRSAAYRWLVGNAARFGFVNYPFEPWHWEWTGEAP